MYTLSALQILCLSENLKSVDASRVADWVCSLQQPDGSFVGDEWGEVDTRFSYCALQILALLGKLPRSGDCSAVDVEAATDFVAKCRNFDGGFGAVPGGESHAGQVFCCVGALAIGGALHKLDADSLGWWLAERQCDSGGLNGRPEKQADVCYSWWVLSSLCMLGRRHWIQGTDLVAFILRCQAHDETKLGGISDHPGDVADVYHTFFGCCGLSMLGYLDEAGWEGHDPVDPVYALPRRLVEAMDLPGGIHRLARGNGRKGGETHESVAGVGVDPDTEAEAGLAAARLASFACEWAGKPKGKVEGEHGSSSKETKGGVSGASTADGQPVRVLPCAGLVVTPRHREAVVAASSSPVTAAEALKAEGPKASADIETSIP